jgi:hypothetical protein
MITEYPLEHRRCDRPIHAWPRLGLSADASSAHPGGSRISGARPRLRASRARGAKRSARV